VNEIYLSTDVEVDGPIPGPYSMLSLGSAAFLPDKTLVGTFTANLHTLPGASSHPETMKWWGRHQEAWKNCRQSLRTPEDAMADYAAWIEKLPGKPVMQFVGRSPFSFAALDIKTMAMAVLRLEYRECAKKNMPKRWFEEMPHNHVALDDAVEQGVLFCNILAESRR